MSSSKQTIALILAGSRWSTGQEWFDFFQSITFRPDQTGRLRWGQNQRVSIIADFHYRLEDQNCLHFEFFDTWREYPIARPTAKTIVTFTRTPHNAYQTARFELGEGVYTFDEPYRQQSRYHYCLRFSSQPFPVGYAPDGDRLDYYGYGDTSFHDLIATPTEQTCLLLLRTLEQSQDAYQLREAAKAVRELGESRAVRPLLALLAKPLSSLVKEQLLLSLGKLAQDEALPAFEQSLKSEDEYLRAAAVEALANYPTTQTLPWLVTALEDKSAMVRQKVIQILGELDTKEVVPVLAGCLNDPVVQVRGLAAQALLQTGGVEALAVLEKFLVQTPFEEGWMVAHRIIWSAQPARTEVTQTQGSQMDYPATALAILRKQAHAKQ